MTNDTPNVLKTSALLMVSRACPTIALLAVNMYYARTLNYDDYASYQSAWLWINALTLLGSIGLPKYLLTFGSFDQLFSAHNRLKLFGIGCIIVVTGFLVSPFRDVFSLAETLFFMATILVQIMVLVCESALLHAHRNKQIMLASCGFSVCFLLGHYIVQQLGFGYTPWLVMMFIAGIFRWWMMRTSLVPDSNDAEKPNELKWIATNDALQFTTKWLDKFILVYLLTPKEFSIYFNGTNEIPLIGVLLAAFGAAFSVHAARSISSERHAIAFRKSASAFSVVLFPLFGWCFFFSAEIVTTLFGDQYSTSAPLFAMMSLLLPIRIMAYTPVLQQQGKGKIVLLGAVLDLGIASALMLMLYPLLSVKGIAMAVVIATYVQVIYYVYHILRSYNAKLIALFEWKLLGGRLLFVVLSFVALRLILWDKVDLLSTGVSLLLFLMLTLWFSIREWKRELAADAAHN